MAIEIGSVQHARFIILRDLVGARTQTEAYLEHEMTRLKVAPIVAEEAIGQLLDEGIIRSTVIDGRDHGNGVVAALCGTERLADVMRIARTADARGDKQIGHLCSRALSGEQAALASLLSM